MLILEEQLKCGRSVSERFCQFMTVWNISIDCVSLMREKGQTKKVAVSVFPMDTILFVCVSKLFQAVFVEEIYVFIFYSLRVYDNSYIFSISCKRHFFYANVIFTIINFFIHPCY